MSIENYIDFYTLIANNAGYLLNVKLNLFRDHLCWYFLPSQNGIMLRPHSRCVCVGYLRKDCCAALLGLSVGLLGG